MLKFELQYATDKGATVSKHIEIAVQVEDMQFRQWVNYHLLVQNWPEWLREFAEERPGKQHLQSSKWGPKQIATYWLEIGKIVQCFTTPAGALKEILNFELLEGAAPQKKQKPRKNKRTPSGYAKVKQQAGPDTASLEAIARKIFTSLATYKAQPRTSFEHRGRTFIVPPSSVTKIGEYEQVLHLPNARAGEVIEALQRSHLYGAKNEQGENVLPDAKYHTDLAMIASICRMKVGGTDEEPELEEIPYGMEKFSPFVDERMQLLADLPANIAIDVSFFLLNSLNSSLRTAMSALPFKSRRERRTQKKQKRSRK